MNKLYKYLSNTCLFLIHKNVLSEKLKYYFVGMYNDGSKNN